ncbi:MAG: DEAD/DEAH box helicase family protein [Planctomycetota bacterium]
MAKRGPRRPSLNATPLWSHQEAAIQTIRRYLTAFGQYDSIGSSLIHMPTGTGKTGVIACASHFLQNAGCVLILCPRIALRDQLDREVSGRFFTKLGFTDNLPKTVHNVKKTFPNIDDQDYPSSIIVMTIQMLYSIRKRFNRDPTNNPLFQKLCDNVDLIVVDEGHYEPALMWRDAIRAIQTPRLIFTATPFRNDLKIFDVNFDHSYSYTFVNAVRDRTIRRVEFHDRQPCATPDDFVADVLNAYDQLFPNPVNSPPRAIIRCDSHAEIRQIGQALEQANRSYVLIHENFSNDQNVPTERKSVPDPNDEDAIFWVHQFKLLEGIDDPRFQLLAMHKEFRNAREIIQQVGRVLRNPRRLTNQIGYVLDHSEGRQKELWDGFLEFDKLLEDEGIEAADFGSKILEAIQAAQPDVVYLDRRFRTGFKLDEINPAEELMLPSTVNVFKKPANFGLGALINVLTEEYHQQDRDVRHVTVGGTEVLLYLTIRNSPLLRSKAFIECKLGVTILHETGDYLCFYDSSGGVPSVADDHIVPVPKPELQKLFRKSDKTYLSAVSLSNSNLGPSAIRARSYSAAKIENTVPGYDEYSFICRTALGYSQENGTLVRRYVGFGRGKITDASGDRLDFTDYLTWLGAVTDVLSGNRNSITSFARFATHVAEPNDPSPQNVLVDVSEVETLFTTLDVPGVTAGEPIEIEDTCCEVTNGNFSLSANGRQCNATIRYDSDRGRYRIESSDLETLYHSQEAGLSRGLVSYLNNQQSMRVIPSSPNFFYTLGSFYHPAIRFGNQYDDDQIGLLKVFSTYQSLANNGSEKGTTCPADGSTWEEDSLFYMIDYLGEDYGMETLFGQPEILVCDDIGTEAADFIAGYEGERRVVFIHAKGNTKDSPSYYGASPLQEVCGQATKNLKYFVRYGDEKPKQATTWHSRNWSGAKGVDGEVNCRIRLPEAHGETGDQIWNRIRAIIRDPNATLEVWLFLGRLFSKSRFESQLRSANPAAEAKQSAYLLFATMASVASVGARLKVVCSP